MNKHLPKLIALLGPTASGKTSMSLRIAKDIGGEIISADSRQIYKYMDIGTAKEPGTWKWRYRGFRVPERVYTIQGMPHYLIDFLDPAAPYSLFEYQKYAFNRIAEIHARDKIPMLVGGTGLYIQSVVDNYVLSDVEPNIALRTKLEALPMDKLLSRLAVCDPDAALSIDLQNKRRVIRAIEVSEQSKVPFSQQNKNAPELFDTLRIGIQIDRETLYTRINARVDQMIATGLLEEIQFLLDKGYTWDLPSMSSVGYCQFQPYFEGTATLESCIDILKRDTRRYAKRQLTWFRRDERVIWCTSIDEVQASITNFLV